MSKWLAIAEKGNDELNSLTDNRQEPAESAFLPVSAVCRESVSEKGDAENLRKPQIENPAKPNIQEAPYPKITLRSEGGASPYGSSPGGRPLTSTGKVVSLGAWRQLSEWEKHGPNGKCWDGRTRKWE